MIDRCLRMLLPLWIAACVVPIPLRAQMADTVILRSGFPVIGEVQSLSRGDLSFDTDEMDVVKIDWDEIALLFSSQFFEVQLASGAEFLGSLTSADTGRLVVVGLGWADTMAFGEVVSIRALERGFWARTNGFIDLGSTLARANRLKSLLAKGRFNYAGPNWGFELSSELYWQEQVSVSAEGDSTKQRTSRNSHSLAGNRFLGARWVITGSGQAEQNEELNLDLRLLGVVGGSFRIVRNRGLELGVGGGLVLNNERYVDEEPTSSLEAALAGQLDAYDVGDIDVFTNIRTYVNPSDGGRLRIDFTGRIAWEIFNDFSVGLNITESLDSRPPSASAQKRDYQYSFSIGWSWS